jgi:hypothetical protein
MVGAAQEVGSLFDAQIVEEANGRYTENALSRTLQCAFADAECLGCVRDAQGFV